MKRQVIIVIFFLALGLAGCDLRQREEALQKREAALDEREQALLLQEKSLQLLEQDLEKQKSLMDSTRMADSTDTAYQINPLLAGVWDVKMTCNATTCTGFAVGDVKTEKWEITYQGNKLIAKAMANDQLVRVYVGTFSGNTIELSDEVPTAQAPAASRMVVRLRLVDNSRLEGEREIIRENDCKVVYALQAQKLAA